MGGRGKGCRSRGGEMAQTMYAHMNKQIKTKRKKIQIIPEEHKYKNP
jgi:hypothetical protein